jgi:hypothetical protein
MTPNSTTVNCWMHLSPVFLKNLLADLIHHVNVLLKPTVKNQASQ